MKDVSCHLEKLFRVTVASMVVKNNIKQNVREKRRRKNRSMDAIYSALLYDV